MLDFYKIRHTKKGRAGEEYYLVQPDFQIIKHEDLMVRGGSFYAIWDQNAGLWSTKEIDVVRIVDESLYSYSELLHRQMGSEVKTLYLKHNSATTWHKFRMFIASLPDNYTELDAKVTFADDEVRKEDYVSKKLSYPLAPGSTEAFDNLFGTLYDLENLTKLMWAIGSVIAGDSKYIQKFYVLHGLPGTGKSTALNLIDMLFEGYSATFEAAAMAKSTNTFALETLKDNPLVAIDHEGDLSKIATNSLLTSVVSHDRVTINAKYKSLYSARLNTTLFIASNKPVMITDRGSGLIRRLVDIIPTGHTVNERDYDTYMAQLPFELGAIAHRCLKLYKQLERNHYSHYISHRMLEKTNHLYNFIDENLFAFERADKVTLTQIWQMYKAYCDEIDLKFRLNRNNFRDEMRDYWDEFYDRKKIDGVDYRSIFVGFKKDVFVRDYKISSGTFEFYDWLKLKEQSSIFDREMKDQPAQSVSKDQVPKYKWKNVKTTLSDLDSTQLHYILPKKNLVTIDFDLKDDMGVKSLQLNLEAARRFPPTYVEVSKSGSGLHLHYYYDGDIEELSRVYDVGIEIIKPVGYTSIRRKLSLCNDHAISTINSGLPLKPKGDIVISKKTISNERALRRLILKNLHKEIHPATAPSVNFIHLILDEAYSSGLRYDVSDMKSDVYSFASNSTNQAADCIKLVGTMKFKSDHAEEQTEEPENGRLVFYDVEVFPNLFLVRWKYEGDATMVEMINPTPKEIESLLQYRLVGFNNRRYDNHILYARYLGYDNQRIYEISKRIVSNDNDAYFREAWGLSYADIYDYASKKQSLKKWQVELGIFHSELDFPWDEPLDEKDWAAVSEYCANDVRSAEAVHNARLFDFHAREILAEISGLRVNDTTRRHAARIIFGDTRYDKHKSEFVHPDLSLEFPGYKFEDGKSMYRSEEVGEGGYVYAEPGMYNNVVYLDIASMHPTSLVEMNLFGSYTDRFKELMDARLAIKENRLDDAREMFDGVLNRYLDDPDELSGLSYALKIILNSVYGFTAAKFNNEFQDSRNKDNVVAKRGALFMVDLKRALQERGCKPIHFKTDSVKIADYTDEDIEFVKEFGEKYGYHFGIEGTFDRMVLINDAVLIGKWVDSKEWHAVGARFAHTYVYKTLFTKESIEFEDLVETRSVQKSSIYFENAAGELVFVGKVGQFVPMKDKGGALYSVTKDRKHAVAGTKGYKWLPAHVAAELEWSDYDLSYFDKLTEEALAKIAEFGDTELFIGD